MPLTQLLANRPTSTLRRGTVLIGHTPDPADPTRPVCGARLATAWRVRATDPQVVACVTCHRRTVGPLTGPFRATVGAPETLRIPQLRPTPAPERWVMPTDLWTLRAIRHACAYRGCLAPAELELLDPADQHAAYVCEAHWQAVQTRLERRWTPPAR